MEKQGIAYCASDFHKVAHEARLVHVKAVFARGDTAAEQLPLTELYDHPDYIDLISAQEFGLEHIFPGCTLLCLPVAQIPKALDDMEQMICATVTENCFAATARQEAGRLLLQAGEWSVDLPSPENAAGLRRVLTEAKAPAAACLAAVAEWCVGYPLHLYLPKELV